MKKVSGLVLLIISLTSCHHVYYAPNTANAPLLSEKGETRINAFYTSGSDSDFGGGEIQAATAVSKNIGVMANFFSAGKSEVIRSYYNRYDSHTERGEGSYAEFAAGYFKNFDKSKRWIGEVYSGFGVGNVKNDYGFGDHSKVGIFKTFIQPAIGYKAPYFEIAFVPKVSFINWKVKDSSIHSQENISVKNEINTIVKKKNFVAFEPAVLIRVGGKNFKIQLGLSFSDYKSTDIYYSKDLIETLNTSLGFSINFNTKKK